MSFAGFLPKRMMPVAVVVVSAAGLSGCFDLQQNVAVRRDGSGTYAVAVSAQGMIGDAIDKHDADFDLSDGSNQAVIKRVRKGDITTQTSETVFRDLSDLKLGDETIAMHVQGKKDDGSEVNFHRTFHIDHARKDRDEDEESFGRDVLHSFFGDHTYTFMVWLPGKIEHIAPIVVHDNVVHPTVWADKYGHTVIWKMPLIDMFMADKIDFDVNFVASGDFHDTQTSPGVRHRNRHHHDDDADDDDHDNDKS
ncbi:MAG: hypothetical protein WDM89_11085 [Rhizomicrobium sp.]